MPRGAPRWAEPGGKLCPQGLDLRFDPLQLLPVDALRPGEEGKAAIDNRRRVRIAPAAKPQFQQIGERVLQGLAPGAARRGRQNPRVQHRTEVFPRPGNHCVGLRKVIPPDQPLGNSQPGDHHLKACRAPDREL